MSNIDDDGALTELARGFRARTLTTLRLAGRLGLGMAKRSVGLDGALKQVDEEDAVRAAGVLLEQLDGLKGLMMKFGQMASYLSPSLPPKAQRILARLQAESRPMAYERIAEVVRAELGQEPGALFDTFERQPFAAASIGQVHRATRAGRELAVKVQYPGVDRLMETDLRTIRRLGRLMLLLTPLDAEGLAEELETRVREECDYQLEAANQRLFRRLLEGPRATVPEVVEGLSARRVLTSHFSPGLSFQAFCDEADQARKNHAATTIFDTVLSCIFGPCIYNGDPHPGNYLFPEDGRVVFLDFGCVKRFSPEFIDRWKRLARTILDQDRAAFPEAFVATGLVARPRRFDFDYQWEVMQYIYTPFLTRRPFTFTHEYVARSYDLMLFRNRNRFRQGLPPDWLFVNRLQWGLNSVLAYLNATGPWPELFRRAVEAPTRPVW